MSEDPLPPEDQPPSGEDLLGLAPSPFAHPEWALNMMLVAAIPFLLLGLFAHPVWLLLGGPFIAVLVIWLTVRVVQWRRPPPPAVDADERSDV